MCLSTLRTKLKQIAPHCSTYLFVNGNIPQLLELLLPLPAILKQQHRTLAMHVALHQLDLINTNRAEKLNQKIFRIQQLEKVDDVKIVISHLSLVFRFVFIIGRHVIDGSLLNAKCTDDKCIFHFGTWRLMLIFGKKAGQILGQNTACYEREKTHFNKILHFKIDGAFFI